MGLVQKSFSDIITFSRTSNATRVGPTGVLEYAPHNLLLQSQTFQTTWTSDANRGSITADAAAAPDGTVTADKLVAGSDNFGYRFQNLTIVNSTVYTASSYLKSAELTFGYFEVPGGGITYFNLSTGVISSLGSGATATITSVGNGWYRCSVTFTSNTTSGYVNLGAANASGSQVATNGSGILLWGAQLAVGPYALDYTPTTNAAVYGPRFDYDGSGVTIVEPVSTNLLTYSEDFSNAAWSKENITVTTNSTTAPDGTVTADTFTENTATLEHFTNQQTSKAATNIPYTFSVYVKRATSGTRNVVVAMTDGTSGGYEAVFDPDDGAILIASRGIGVTTGWTPGAATATNAGNGWWRFTFSIVSNTSTRIDGVVYMADGTTKTYTGNGSSNLFVWGAQLEVGSTATAYMVSGASNGFRAVPVVSGSATPKGLLVEEQRQNLVTYSEQFDNAAWTKLNASVTANAATSPNGTVSADLLIPDTSSSNQHGVYQPLGATAGTPYTQSVFAKAAGYNWLLMTEGNNVTAQASFNLATGVVGTVSGTGSPSATITSLGNGWYRCTLTYTPIATSQNIQVRAANADAGPTFAGNGTSGIYIWGAQLE